MIISLLTCFCLYREYGIILPFLLARRLVRPGRPRQGCWAAACRAARPATEQARRAPAHPSPSPAKKQPWFRAGQVQVLRAGGQHAIDRANGASAEPDGESASRTETSLPESSEGVREVRILSGRRQRYARRSWSNLLPTPTWYPQFWF
jgi:hypothetical protein